MTQPPISQQIAEAMRSASWIRAMFEKGVRLKAELGEQNVFDFSLGNPNAAPPEAFFRALRDCAAVTRPAAHRYMNNAGFDETRQAIAGMLNREYGIAFIAKQVIAACGAAGGINVALRAMLNPGDEVIVLAPFFVEYKFYIAQAGGRMVVAQTTRDCLPDFDALAAAISDRTRAIIVNTPNNPSGVVYPEDVCRELGALLRKHDRPERPIYLLTDDIYKRLVYDIDRCPSPAEFYPRTVVVSSFSKDLSIPGERAGYIAVHPELPDADLLVAAMIMVTRTLGFVNAPGFMQRVVARCLDSICDKDFYRGNRDLLCDALRSYGYEMPPPGGAFYAFPRSPIADDAAFIDVLAEQRILAVPGSGFGRPGHFRLSYCVDRGTIERSLPGFKAAMAEAS
jgi:aspartate aminotransferase